MHPNELPLTPGADALADRSITIKVVGVGGAGGSSVDRIRMENLDRLQMAVINTDLAALNASLVEEKLLIGAASTRGLSAGGDPELGYQAADGDREKIAKVVEGCDLIFLIAGMGGGTGSGAAPVVAEEASAAGALVIAFVAMPFSFEGTRRGRQAEDGLLELRRHADAVIPLSNDLLIQEGDDAESALNSFARADEWIGRAVRSVWSMMFRTGFINLDFATFRQAFHTRGGKTLFGLAAGSGDDLVKSALESLEMCPLLVMPEFARKVDRVLVNVVGGTDMTLAMFKDLMTALNERFGRDSHVIMGAVIDEDFQGRLEICVIGTSDIGGRMPPRRTPVRPRVTERAGPLGTPEPVERVREVETKGSAGRPHKQFHKQKVAQDEFSFGGAAENRGHFERTDRNLFEGQDLDVPTFLRKGIKISI